MKTCQTCQRPAADSTLLACVDCGALLHLQCALSRLAFIRGRPAAVTVCDPCFDRWLLTVPALLRGVSLAEVSQMSRVEL